ncbi:MAG: T9SS C-terminal target domain-containing protein [Ignavibacteriales bacterium]|nr:MAG: T9SS C-terminal target domain-containing protein [Ignavibacteriales bacterium]
MKSFLHLLCFLLLFSFSFSDYLFSQDVLTGKKIINENGKILYQTIPEKNSSTPESLNDHIYGLSPLNPGKQFAFGGSVIWSADDQGTAAIADFNELNFTGQQALTSWNLNQMRVSLYSDQNNIPLWEFPTLPNGAHVDFSEEGNRIAVAAGTNVYVLDTSGAEVFNLAMPDSFYASVAAIDVSGYYAVFLANAFGNSNTARIYYIDLNFTPVIKTFDVPVSEISNWTGVDFSNLNDEMVVNGRNHIYVFDILGTNFELIWDRFLDNTESPAVISGDGTVIVTADNSGFVQTWAFDATNEEYYLLWQYRVPAGTFTNWASSVDISADGSTIVAGSLLFFSAGYDGTVMAFDTYGDGTPKWIYSGAGDLVDDIALSDNGKVAAAVTWGDLAHTKGDLLVFDVETGEVTFEVISPGSFFSCDISYDGKRVFAGGKAVHAREFGNGGRIYLAEINLGGGNVSGTVDLTNSADDSGVIVNALGTVRSAVTDVSGNYLIENLPAGSYTISAEKPGYNFGEVTSVAVTEGSTTTGINFSLSPFPVVPPTLSASTNLPGAIMLSWATLMANPQRELEIAKMVGDDLSPLILSVYDTKSIIDPNSGNSGLVTNLNLTGVDSIAVYRSLIPGGPYEWIASTISTKSNYIDSSVFPLRNYYYVINVFNDIGQSVYSNEAIGMVSDTLITFSLDVPQASIPTIDGVLSPGEWDDAFKLDISDLFGYGSGSPKPQGTVIMYLKYDDNTDMLYIGGEDFLNPTLNDNEGFGLYFDDNNNNIFDSNPPFIQEGNFWAYWHPGGSDLRFRDLVTFEITTLTDGEVAFSDGSGHLQGEVAIPMGFLEGYQLQVFGPDKAPGLGAFLIARQPDQSTIFNGWWPQTMNSLFNPQYFGDVGINVNLLAPPQAPSDISVARQGDALLVTWMDPALGLNNAPLPVPPTIDLYKNGELLTTFNAGVQTYLDNDVVCSGWYEYQLQATIIVGQDTLTGPISSPFGNFACVEPSLTAISYDDGEWDGFYVASFSWEENKFATRFTPQSYPTYLRRIVTTTNGDDEFDFTVHNDNGGIPGNIIAGPYRVHGTTPPGTVNIITKTLPGLDPPLINSGDFWIVINWLEPTPGVPGIGVDFDPPIDNRSFYFLTSSGWQSIGGDILLTAYVSGDPIPVELTSFTASISNDKIELNWQTASELNNLGFELERKTKDKEFEKIAFLAGHGTTTDYQSYSYTDKPEVRGIISYRLKQIDFNGDINYSNIIEVDFTTPKEFALYQNYPNPFNPSTIISYQLPKSETVSLEIYNELGEKVNTLVNGMQEAGYYTLEWNGNNNAGNPVSSGMYLYRIKAGNFVNVHKMILLR